MSPGGSGSCTSVIVIFPGSVLERPNRIESQVPPLPWFCKGWRTRFAINICTINRYPNRLRSFTVTCPGEPHCPNPSPIGVLFGPQPCFYIKGLRRKWSIYMTKINKKYFVLSSWLPLPDLPLPSLYSLWPWGWRPLASMWTRRLWTRWITSTKRRLSI